MRQLLSLINVQIISCLDIRATRGCGSVVSVCQCCPLIESYFKLTKPKIIAEPRNQTKNNQIYSININIRFGNRKLICYLVIRYIYSRFY